ncbi:hypothetical protein [Bacillus thermotolerans]|uniref:Uncharacterized protein n=1 Tax=Bacillus thermotolerans TaxID=1221996 RepID=A0A0F5I416_BACTR|nr:hypothetical protein [Bacillus thermotolerans]KKB37163.1 hypothetical protein QY97_00537 [Bacillus thermotolerans]KKB40193.1 hypothetical protein QY95_01826 [Bacillus thermotolerans]KKB42599.1 hypothetical protein QY96_01372 [Bacillus thermotolerans]
MHLDNFAGQKIQIKLRNFPEELVGEMTGIYRPDEWHVVKLIRNESMGIWVENPCHKRIEVLDDAGVEIPVEEQKEETCVAHLFIRWEYISSVITFPDQNVLGLAKKVQRIGFHA